MMQMMTRTAAMHPLKILTAVGAALLVWGLVLAYNASPARAADGCTTTAGITTCTFASTGSEQTFQVPDGVSTIHVVATGAPGALGELGDYAGRGAQVSGNLTGLVAGQDLYVNVGGAADGESGGFNGGGSSGHYGGGGGGASEVRAVSRSGDSLESLESRRIVAGGGGGSGGFVGCTDGFRAGGDGGDAGSDGGNGEPCGSLAGGTGGKAGTQSEGGLGGIPDGQSGSLGQGGDGALFGGGGGGGYYGGGGGGDKTSAGSSDAPGGGGGGGSNLVPAGGTATIADAGPSITISYTDPAADTTAPTLSVSHAGANADNWNNTSPVTLNLSASDTGSGLASAPTCKDGTTDLTLKAGATAGTWTASVSGEGTHAIECSVSDNAGNSKSATDTVKIDTKAPSVSCSVSPSKLSTSANNHKLVTVTASVSVTDSGGSGTDPISTNRFTLVSVTSNQPQSGLARDDVANDIQGWTTGTADTSGQLRAERYGGARTYTLTYQGKDLAGNTKNCQATVTVPKGG